MRCRQRSANDSPGFRCDKLSVTSGLLTVADVFLTEQVWQPEAQPPALEPFHQLRTRRPSRKTAAATQTNATICCQSHVILKIRAASHPVKA